MLSRARRLDDIRTRIGGWRCRRACSTHRVGMGRAAHTRGVCAYDECMFKSQEEEQLWVTFAAAALSGTMSSGSTGYQSHAINAGQAADTLIKEWRKRKESSSLVPPTT
jgi:hypothetical protein